MGSLIPVKFIVRNHLCKKNVWRLMRPKGGKTILPKSAEDDTLCPPLHNFYWAALQQMFLLSYNKSSGLDLEPDLLRVCC